MKGELKVFQPGEVIFREGEPGGSLFFLKEGKVEVFRERDGIEVVFSTMGQGEVLGTVSIFDKSPRSASARASTRVSALFVTCEALDSNLKLIPVWVTAVLKDMVVRLRAIDEKLLDAKVQEKHILERVGTIYQHAAQLASLLAGLVRIGTVEEYGEVLFPLKGFIARAESVILRDADYLEKIFGAFVSGGLIRVKEDKKYGESLLNPKAGALEDFSVFSLEVSRKGTKGFLPIKLGAWIGSLVRIHKRDPDREFWPRQELTEALCKDMGRATVNGQCFSELEQQGILVPKGGKNSDELMFSAQAIQRRLIFETVIRGLEGVSEKAA